MNTIVPLADMATSISLLAIVAGIYFLPLIIAAERKVPNLGSVGVINVLLGWTLIGWVVAMAMAARSVAKPAAVVAAPRSATFDCPHCLEPVKVGATVCPHCQRDIPAAEVPSVFS